MVRVVRMGMAGRYGACDGWQDAMVRVMGGCTRVRSLCILHVDVGVVVDVGVGGCSE